MKTFIYTKELSKTTKQVILHIYRIKKNTPEHIVDVVYHRGSNYGDETEVFRALVNAFEVPYDWSKMTEGFYLPSKLKDKMRIIYIN